MRLRFWVVSGAFSLVAAGCANNDIIIRKQAEMDARMEQLIQANAGNSARLTELFTTVQELQGQVRSASTELRELKSTVDTLTPRAEVKPSPVLPPKIIVVEKGGAAESDAAEQDAYMKAFGLFSANNYAGAILAFEAFIRQHPGSEYAGNAQYWIGECYYTQRDYGRALDAFNRVIEGYAKGKKVPDAMLKVGFTLISLNQPDKARSALEALVEKYPKSPAAAKARERLSR